ncbi:MAG: hypothetical protein FD129_919, partial [bacterium]
MDKATFLWGQIGGRRPETTPETASPDTSSIPD